MKLNRYQEELSALRYTQAGKQLLTDALTTPQKRPVPARRRRKGRIALVAAALAAVLIMTPALAAQSPPLYEILYRFSPATAQYFVPVQLSDSAAGIEMQVEAVYPGADALQAYITLRDLEADRLKDGADLYDSYSINHPQSAALVSGGCTPLGYDPETGTAGFLVTLSAKDGAGGSVDLSGGKYTFSLGTLLVGSKKQDVEPELDWALIETEPTFFTTELRGLGGVDALARSSVDGDSGSARVLTPVCSIPLAENLRISAVAYVDGVLHVQYAADAADPDAHGFFTLTAEDGNAYPFTASLHFEGEDGTRYVESLVEIDWDELSACRLSGTFWSGGTLIEGPWRVTFCAE